MKPDFRLINYHSHTTRCLHAQGTEEQFVLQAIETGYESLGFADHSAWPYKSDFAADMRMPISQLDDYVKSVKAIREKYADKIRIHLALECEAFPEFYPWLREVREEMGFEYFILGNHYDTNDETGGLYFGGCSREAHLYRYMETTIAGMESGLFAYLCHPDLFLHRYRGFGDAARKISRELCEAAKRLNMPLEYNFLGHKRNPESRLRGYTGYTSREFWEIAAETGNRAILGVDAHCPKDLDCLDLYMQVREMMKTMGIEVVEALEGID